MITYTRAPSGLSPAARASRIRGSAERLQRATERREQTARVAASRAAYAARQTAGARAPQPVRGTTPSRAATRVLTPSRDGRYHSTGGGVGHRQLAGHEPAVRFASEAVRREYEAIKRSGREPVEVAYDLASPLAGTRSNPHATPIKTIHKVR